jgi:ABC-type polysaccharide/polyol phosphate transport system ATPase subunit
MARITFSDVHVTYPVYSSSRQRSILGFAANRASFGRVAQDAGRIPVVDALNGISFDLRDGDRLALMGRNGSGKTTILKVCAGLILPDSGRLEIEGRRATILNPSAGLDTEKTGVENIEMIGRLLGVPRAKRRALLQDVAEFTELGEFLTLPVRTYSSGMTVRLLFALATSVERDILIVDEIIGVGDALFMEKAARRVRSMFDRAKILILASHAGEIAAKLCNRAMWIESGREVATGEPEAVWDAYVHQRRPQVESGVVAA